MQSRGRTSDRVMSTVAAKAPPAAIDREKIEQSLVALLNKSDSAAEAESERPRPV
jgi:hypothetical protein